MAKLKGKKRQRARVRWLSMREVLDRFPPVQTRITNAANKREHVIVEQIPDVVVMVLRYAAPTLRKRRRHK